MLAVVAEQTTLQDLLLTVVLVVEVMVELVHHQVE